MSKNKTGREEKTSIHEKHIERILPYKSMLFFCLIVSSLIFLSLIFLYIIWLTKNPVTSHINLPRSFVISTIILLWSNYPIAKAQYAFRIDDSHKLVLCFLVIFGLSLFFSAFQTGAKLSTCVIVGLAGVVLFVLFVIGMSFGLNLWVGLLILICGLVAALKLDKHYFPEKPEIPQSEKSNE